MLAQLPEQSKAYKYHDLKADVYFHKGNYPEMIYHLLQKVKIDPKDVQSWSDIGYYYWSLSVDNKDRKTEFQDKAINSLKKGLELNKNSYYMWDEIGKFHLYRDKQFNLAKEYFQKAVEFKDCPMVTYHFFALCYELENNYGKAIKILEDCLKKFPNDEKAKSKIKSLKESNF